MSRLRLVQDCLQFKVSKFRQSKFLIVLPYYLVILTTAVDVVVTVVIAIEVTHACSEAVAIAVTVSYK